MSAPKAAVLACTLLCAAGCSRSHARDAVDPAGAYRFELADAGHREGDGQHALWHVKGGLTVVAQRTPRASARGQAHSIEEVAVAITTRYRAGEVKGAMKHWACRVAGTSGQCLRGWIASRSHPKRHLAREGVIVPVGKDYVVVEAMADSRDAVEHQVQLVRDSFERQ